MDSYSYDSTFALGEGPLAFDDDAFTYDVAGPSLSLYRELMDQEERLLEEEHNDCEDVELFSDAWLHRPASLLDELTAAGELDFLGETLSAETQDVSIAKEEDLQVKSIAGNAAPVMNAVAARAGQKKEAQGVIASRIPRLIASERSRITSPVRAKVLPAHSRVPEPKVVAPRGSSSTSRGASRVISTPRPALKNTVAPAQYRVSSTARPALRMTVAPAQASVQRKAPVSLANRTSLAPQKKRTDRA